MSNRTIEVGSAWSLDWTPQEMLVELNAAIEASWLETGVMPSRAKIPEHLYKVISEKQISGPGMRLLTVAGYLAENCIAANYGGVRFAITDKDVEERRETGAQNHPDLWGKVADSLRMISDPHAPTTPEQEADMKAYYDAVRPKASIPNNSALAFLMNDLARQDVVMPFGITTSLQPPTPRRPTPPGPKRYEMNDDRMTCFEAPDNEAGDAPDEVTEWIAAQDYEAEMAAKDAEIKALEIQLGKLIVPPHEFRPFGSKKIWCDVCGQREGSKTHSEKKEEPGGHI